jgi:hypothetical protein
MKLPQPSKESGRYFNDESDPVVPVLSTKGSFMLRLDAVSDCSEKLVARFKADFGESL